MRNISRLRRILAEAGTDPLQAALAFALSQTQASRIVVGVASPLEFRAILAAVNAPAPALDWSALALDDLCLLRARRCAVAA